MNKTKKLLSLCTAAAISVSAFAGLATTAGAAANSLDTSYVAVDFSSNPVGDLTLDGSKFKDVNGAEVSSVTSYISNGTRVTYPSVKIESESENNYFSTTMKLNNGTKTSVFDTGALLIGGRAADKKSADAIGKTFLLSADVKFYNDFALMWCDQTNSDFRGKSTDPGYLDYIALSYNSTDNEISWKGEQTKKIDASKWHNIRAFDVISGSSGDATHTVKLYIDEEYIGETTLSQTKTANGANTPSVFAVKPSKVGNAAIDLDNIEIYSLGDDSAAKAIISVANDAAAYIDPTENRTLQLSGKVIHNVTDNIDITSFYSALPEWSVKDSIPGVEVSTDGLVTVAEDFDTNTYDSATIVYTAGTKVGEINISIGSKAGYIINTTPYSQIKVGDDEPVTAGASGTYTFDPEATGSYDVVISKDGYVTKEETVTPEANRTIDLSLSLENGIYYKEDFAYVEDNFGVESANTTVQNGVMTITASEDNLEANIALPATVGLGNKLLTIDIGAHAMNTDNGITVELNGLTAENKQGEVYTCYTDYGKTKDVWRFNPGNGQGYSKSTENDADISHKLQFYYNSSNNRLSMYMDGKYVQVLGGMKSITLNGLKITFSKWDETDPSAIKLNSITVSDKPAEYTISIDGSSGTYLEGTTVTIPEAGENYIWQDEQGSVVKAGDITANKNLTLTKTKVVTGSIETAKTGKGDKEFTGTLDETFENDLLATPVSASLKSDIAYKDPKIQWFINYEEDVNSEKVGKTARTAVITYTGADMEADVAEQFGAVFTGVNLKYLKEVNVQAALVGGTTEE